MTTNSKNARENAYERIQGLILGMEIKPGETITENAISDRLEIGRTPVREALKKLEQEGLVITTNRRKRVYLLTVKELEEIFDIKIRLETYVAFEAARNCTSKDVEKLMRIIENMRAAAFSEAGTEEEEHRRSLAWLKHDKALHHQLFTMAGNSKVEQIIRSLDLQWQRLRLGIYTLEGRMQRSYDEHMTFVEAIIRKEPEEANRLMKAHLKNVKFELIKLFKMFNYPIR